MPEQLLAREYADRETQILFDAIELQAIRPDIFAKIMQKLWDETPQTERDTLYQSFSIAERNDPKLKQIRTKDYLLGKYLVAQTALRDMHRSAQA